MKMTAVATRAGGSAAVLEFAMAAVDVAIVELAMLVLEVARVAVGNSSGEA